MQAGDGSAQRQMRQARNLRREAWRRLGDEPFQPQQVLAELERARAMEGQGRAELDRRIVEFAAGLSQDERRRMGEALAAQGRGGGSGRRAALADREARLSDR